MVHDFKVVKISRFLLGERKKFPTELLVSDSLRSWGIHNRAAQGHPPG